MKRGSKRGPTTVSCQLKKSVFIPVTTTVENQRRSSPKDGVSSKTTDASAEISAVDVAGVNATLARGGLPFPILLVNVCATIPQNETNQEDDPAGALFFIVFVMLFYSIGIFLFLGLSVRHDPPFDIETEQTIKQVKRRSDKTKMERREERVSAVRLSLTSATLRDFHVGFSRQAGTPLSARSRSLISDNAVMSRSAQARCSWQSRLNRPVILVNSGTLPDSVSASTTLKNSPGPPGGLLLPEVGFNASRRNTIDFCRKRSPSPLASPHAAPYRSSTSLGAHLGLHITDEQRFSPKPKRHLWNNKMRNQFSHGNYKQSAIDSYYNSLSTLGRSLSSISGSSLNNSVKNQNCKDQLSPSWSFSSVKHIRFNADPSASSSPLSARDFSPGSSCSDVMNGATNFHHHYDHRHNQLKNHKSCHFHHHHHSQLLNRREKTLLISRKTSSSSEDAESESLLNNSAAKKKKYGTSPSRSDVTPTKSFLAPPPVSAGEVCGAGERSKPPLLRSPSRHWSPPQQRSTTQLTSPLRSPLSGSPGPQFKSPCRVHSPSRASPNKGREWSVNQELPPTQQKREIGLQEPHSPAVGREESRPLPQSLSEWQKLQGATSSMPRDSSNPSHSVTWAGALAPSHSGLGTPLTPSTKEFDAAEKGEFQRVVRALSMMVVGKTSSEEKNDLRASFDLPLATYSTVENKIPEENVHGATGSIINVTGGKNVREFNSHLDDHSAKQIEILEQDRRPFECEELPTDEQIPTVKSDSTKL